MQKTVAVGGEDWIIDDAIVHQIFKLNHKDLPQQKGSFEKVLLVFSSFASGNRVIESEQNKGCTEKERFDGIKVDDMSLQCIAAAGNKSMEELRWEHYSNASDSQFRARKRIALFKSNISRTHRHLESNQLLPQAVDKWNLGGMCTVIGQKLQHKELRVFEDYGAAIICKSNLSKRCLYVLGLDEWTFNVHETAPAAARKLTFDSNSGSYRLLYICAVFDSELSDLMRRFDECFIGASTKVTQTGTAPSISNNRQRTPAFIHAVFMEAYSSFRSGTKTNTVVQPKGAFTDVGQHTGFEARATLWPLFLAILKEETGSQVEDLSTFPLMICRFYLWLARRQLDHLLVKSKVPTYALNATHKMISVAALQTATECNASNMQLSLELEQESNDLHNQLVDLYRKMYAERSKMYSLANIPVKPPQLSIVRYNISLPPSTASCDFVQPLNGEELALKNLDPWRLSFHSWFHGFNKAYFGHAMKLNCAEALKFEISAVSKDFDIYQREFRKYTTTNSVLGDSLVELRSLHLLISWTAFCVCHRALCIKYPVFEEFGVCLDWRQLKVLVLSDDVARQSALEVARYLYKIGDKKPVFSRRNNDATFEMVAEFCDRNDNAYAAKLIDIWNEFEQDSKNRIAARVEDIEIQKEEYEEAVEELQQAKEELEEMRLSFDASTATKRERSEFNRAWRLQNDKIRAAEAAVRELSTVENLFLALPSRRNRGLQVLFFTFLENDMRVFYNMGFQCQALLLPSSLSDNLCGNICEAYETNVANDVVTAELKPDKLAVACKEIMANGQRRFELVSTAKKVQYSRTSLHNCTSELDGVFYADHLVPKLCWEGGVLLQPSLQEYLKKFPDSTRGINPFAFDNKAAEIAASFVPQLPADSLMLSKYVLLHDGTARDSTRGNWSFCDMSKRPDWMKLIPFVDYSTLRAFPYRQRVKLCCALAVNRLPFEQKEVGCLFQTCLYQLGELAYHAEADELVYDWTQHRKDDMELLAYELDRLYDVVKDKPREFKCVRMLVELCSFGSQYSNRCRAVARKFSALLMDWSAEIDARIKNNDIDGSRDAMRLHHCTLLCYVLMCHRYGELNNDDVSSILISNALIDRLCIDFAPSFELNELRCHCHYIIARRLKSGFKMFYNQFDEVADAVGYANIKGNWVVVSDPQRVNSCTNCYSAKAGNDTLSFNVLNGRFLVNGIQIQGLSTEITEHPLYRRVFGGFRWEVSTFNGISLTAPDPVTNVYYKFATVTKSSDLLITQHRKGNEDLVFELLDNQLFRCLPFLLRDRYCHWIWRAQNIVILVSREDSFVRFMGRLEPASSSLNSLNLFEIPHHCLFKVFQQSHLDLFEGQIAHRILVSTAEDRIVTVLSKFEEVQFIHKFWYDTRREASYHLPNLDLKFEAVSEVLALEPPTIRCFPLYDCYLSVDQQFDMLYGFSAYLCLHNEFARKILVRNGELVKADEGTVTIRPVSFKCRSQQYHIYDFNERFNTLAATSVCSRLFLAALYAATSTSLPESGSAMTGVEYACTLVRSCWVNRPLTEEEEFHRQQVVHFAFQCPALQLLCDELLISSTETYFLYGSGDRPLHDFSSDSMTQYRAGQFCDRFRQALTSVESNRIFGAEVLKSEGALRARYCEKLHDHVSSSQFCSVFVEEKEACLCGCVSILQPEVIEAADQSPLCSIGSEDEVGVISQKLCASLQKSYAIFSELPRQQICSVNIGLLSDTTRFRRELQEYLVNSISSMQLNHPDILKFRLRRLAQMEPSITTRDFLQIARDRQCLACFNPFLSEPDAMVLHSLILLWLKVCVLEDKLRRIDSLSRNDVENADAIIAECTTQRNWDVAEHIEWLIFEVEQGIQIRPIQYQVANSIINEPNSLVQLNMGEGKTKVIVPILLLYWCRTLSACNATNTKKAIVRVNFLSQLLDHAYDDLHATLTASSFHLRLFRLPFNRDVKLGMLSVTLLSDQLHACADTRGCAVVCPEHRMSLKLKREESVEAIKVHFDSSLCPFQFTEILDESDEILRHKNQLIYAVGTQQNLVGSNRWVIAEHLLKLIWTNQDIVDYLNPPTDTLTELRAVREDYTTLMGNAFCPRLLPAFKEESNLRFMRQLLAKKVCEQPPHELLWLANPQYSSKLESIQRFITSTATDVVTSEEVIITIVDAEMQTKREDLLILRGLIGYDVIVNALTKKFRVEFGINRANYRRIAVPFRACDTPSERSEYSHPDLAIALTIISYFRDGLSLQQMTDAFKHMLSLSAAQQEHFYDVMYQRSRRNMNDLERSRLDSVMKLDVTNANQTELLHKFYSHNLEMVCFWLNSFVFPEEMKVFPEKLVTSAWDIAESTNVVGFSGTDDNELLFPLQVRMNRIADPQIAATNGKMVSLLVQNRNRRYEQLAEDDNVVTQLLSTAVKLRAQAIIDCGGLIAGRTNRAVAQQWLSVYLDGLGAACQFSAVTFFDTEHSSKGWYVHTKSGQDWAVRASPIAVHDTLVLFDESRCRGTDFRLRQDACALVTLGIGMGKDKLMQAVGRMRQLQFEQRVVFVGGKDVTNSIRSLCGLATADATIESTHVLEWTIRNTVQTVKDGMMLWASQGMSFCRRNEVVTTRKEEPEMIDLKAFYGGATDRASLVAVTRKEAQKLTEQQLVISPMGRGLLARIVQHVESNISADFGVNVIIDDECEREIETEKIREQEKTNELPPVEAEAEVDWNYADVASMNMSAIQLKSEAVSLWTFFSKYFSPELATILNRLPTLFSRIFVTRNFMLTIKLNKSMPYINEYCRPIDGFLYFEREDAVLLLSDREANGLDRFTKVSTFAYTTCTADARSINITTTTVTNDSSSSSSSPGIPASILTVLKDCKQLVLMKLYNGCVSFETEAQKQALIALLSGPHTKEAACLLPTLRGLKSMIDRSDLDVICKKFL